MRFDPKETNVILVLFVLYILSWFSFLVVSTLSMRGFYVDSSLEFLMHVSESYVFGKDSRLVHLFSVGLPRDAQLFISALGVQAPLLFGITNPNILKYCFLFWQAASPGVLYLILLAVLYRQKKLEWSVFPLICWCIVTVTMDWNPVSSLRWFWPLSWMHFYAVILFSDRVKSINTLVSGILGIIFFLGIYEAVFLYAPICIGFAGLILIRDRKVAPLVNAMMIVPGACRALYSYFTYGHLLPHGFKGFAFPYIYHHPYFLVIFFLPIVIPGMKRPDDFINFVFGIFILVFAYFSLCAFPAPYPGTQMFRIRFDYMIVCFLMMAWAGLLYLWRIRIVDPAYKISIVLALGCLMWIAQIRQDHNLPDCARAFRGKIDLLQKHQIPNGLTL